MTGKLTERQTEPQTRFKKKTQNTITFFIILKDQKIFLLFFFFFFLYFFSCSCRADLWRMYPYAMQAEQITEPWLHPELKVFGVDVRALVSKTLGPTTWSEPSRRIRAMLTFSFGIYDASPGRKISPVGIIASMLEDPSATGSLEGQRKLVVEVSAESRSRNSSCSGTKWLCWDTVMEAMLLPATCANRQEF